MRRIADSFSVGAILAVLIGIAAVLIAHFDQKTPHRRSADILVLGDSQLSFGAGPVLSEFFSRLPESCTIAARNNAARDTLSRRRFAMIGTRSTSLHSWVTTSGPAWNALCAKDKKWGVNASVWGTIKPPQKRYVQVGTGPDFQVCRLGRTPLQNLFSANYYTPKLLIAFFGGNGAARLARNPDAAKHDVAEFVRWLPSETRCIFMMTAPVYPARLNKQRRQAQAHLRDAFAAHGQRCTFVEGHTPQTRAAIEGRSIFFRRNEAGKVIDPYHASQGAAAIFLSLRRVDLCRALLVELMPGAVLKTADE